MCAIQEWIAGFSWIADAAPLYDIQQLRNHAWKLRERFRQNPRMTEVPLNPFARNVLLPIVVALLMAGGARADSSHPSDIGVRVHVDGGVVTVDVEFFVRASPEEAWAVMTDFDNAARFIGKLHESRVLSRTQETLVVAQKGTMGLGPFSVPLESVSEIRLEPPQKIQSRMISGNMKKYDSETELLREAEGTRVVYRVESIPDVWIPPLIGRAMIEFETRSRFRQLVEEILRRKASPEPGK
jgi:hypothetical protein